MRTSIQKVLILALLAMSQSFAKAAILSQEEAKGIAVDFFQSGNNHRLASKDAFILVHTVTDDSKNPVCYVFNAKDGKGFVIVSADDHSLPVIGYSDDSTWKPSAFPEAAMPVIAKPVADPLSNVSLKKSVRKSAGVENKLLSTPTWSQEAPFNNNIPNHRLTGCVGVAVAEIMKYHSYPEERPSSLVNSQGTYTYDWNSMRNDNYRNGYSDAEASSVATLVADAAIGIGTDFGMSSSSAFEVRVPYALTSLFGYDSGVSYKKRSEMTKEDWEAVIVNEINENRPVLYSGQDVSSGHAFVCDGYEKRGDSYFFHINWGWGGSANGYYASNALNPVVSKAHSYNDLTTIVYNIKPASNAISWSPIHITSDDRQVGLTTDVADISSTSSFTVRAGSLKNISTKDFSGKLAVALFDSNGNMKSLLNEGSNFNLISLQTMKFVDFSCKVPSGTVVNEADVVRLATKSSDSEQWLPVAGDLLATGEVPAKGAEIPYFQISIPSDADFVEISADDNKVIKGRDYSFRIVPKAADKVVTVKANGFILTPNASNIYKIVNVIEDQKINIVVQNAADVLSKSTLWLEAGNLKNLLDENETSTVVDLTLFGTMNAEDFTFIRERMKLNRLDISQVRIVASGSNPANAIPTKAFTGCRSLKTIILPSTLTTFKNGCLAQTGLTSIEVPASVGTWEYNVFVGCNALNEVIVRRSSPAWINWCVFNGTPKTKLVVPIGASSAYKSKEYWQEFKNIIEENAVAPDNYTVSVQEKKGLNIAALTEGTEFAPGASYSFTVESDDSHGDSKIEVYANADRLFADTNGIFSVKVNRNTLIHVEFKDPEPTTIDNQWKITAAEGGIGLVSDVINVPVGKAFNVRVNAIKVPAGYSSKFFAIALTNKEGAIKEVISTVLYNMISEDGGANNLTYNFNCKVKEASVREGDQLRLVTSYSANEKNRPWMLVEADAEGVCDRLSAINNPVRYHTVTLPANAEQYNVDGVSGEVVRGMPYTFKVTPTDTKYRVSVSLNGVEKANNVAVANITVPAVTEDIEVRVSFKELSAGEVAAANEYVTVKVSAGQLASKMGGGWPEKLKLVGSLNANDFTTMMNNSAKIKDLDLSDVTVPDNKFPGYAFANIQSRTLPTVRTLILPKSATNIGSYAFYRCTSLKEVVLPSSLTQLSAYAFAGTNSVSKLTIERTTPPTCNYAALPSNRVTINVPESAINAYKSASYWSNHNIAAIEGPKASYHIDVDPARFAQYGSYDLNNIQVGNKEEIVWLALPNVQRQDILSKVSHNCRYGVAFKFYDNGVDMFATADDSDVYDWSWNSSKQGGIYKIYFNPNDATGLKTPANHKIDLDFFYPVTFSNAKGTDGIKAQIVNAKAEDEWKNVEMWRFGGEGTPTLYKEGSDVQFSLSLPEGINNSDLNVKVEHKVITKSGLIPEYEYQEFEVASVDGIYTIPSLPGETNVKISPLVAPEDDGTLTAEEIIETASEVAEEITQIVLSGEMTENAFEALNEKFKAAEVIDLSGIENTAIPDGAFAGMENLQIVTIPETVTEIGAGAFEGCDNIETLTLPGVTSIGEGAFEGCLNLTSIIIPSAGSSASSQSAYKVRAKAPGASGISVESFRGLNPNCLIYVGSQDLADSESLNIILNVDDNRVAASDIILDGNHRFNAPASFNLGDHKISLTVDIPASQESGVDGGWKGIILPFTPSGIEFGKDFASREGSGLVLMSFDGEESENLTLQTSIEANRPYMAHVCAPFSSVPVTFTAFGKAQEGAYDVPFTPVPEETVAVGKNFSLYGSFDGETILGSCMTLSEDGKAFVSMVDDEDNVGFFDAYICSNTDASVSELGIGSHPYWVEDPSSSASGKSIYHSEKIELSTATPGAEIYYTIDGSDPASAAYRMKYEAPFSLENYNTSIKAVAEFQGNLSDVVTFEYELKKVDIKYDLAQNWNWISHNMEKPVAVSEFVSDGVSRIISQTKESVRDPKFGMVGNLTQLEPGVAYKVCVADDSWTGGIEGFACDPTSVVNLNSGWNWIGNPVGEASTHIMDLFSGLEAEEGDMVVGLEGFSQYVSGEGWKGTLSNLVPGVGYMYYSNSDKQFVYNMATSSGKVPAKTVAHDGLWSVDIHKYPSVMPLTAILITDKGLEADASDYEVAAFCGDECRGVGVLVDGKIMINAHGEAGDMIGFRYVGHDGVELQSVTEIPFDEEVAYLFSNPLEICMASTTAVGTLGGASLMLECNDGNIILKGDVPSDVTLEVYDLSGKIIAKSSYIDNGSVRVSELEEGIYMIIIRGNGSSINRKVMVK